MTNNVLRKGDTSTRVLETLKLLYSQGASVRDIIKHFQKIEPNNRLFTSEVILKYINTLKVFGFRIVKQKDKYILLNTIDNIDLNSEELKSLKLLLGLSAKYPEEKIQKHINIFSQTLEKYFSENTKFLSQKIEHPVLIKPDSICKVRGEKVREFEGFCDDGLRLKLSYRVGTSLCTILADPIGIKYKDDLTFISVYDSVKAQICDIDIDKVEKVNQLPNRVGSVNFLTSVMFKLKGTLASNYKLKEGERLVEIDKSGHAVVINQLEDRELLLSRLLKYGENCEVISPKSYRNEMLQRIESVLSLYEG